MKKMQRSTRNKRKGVYEKQRRRTTQNKIRKLKKHLEHFPNESQGKEKLKELQGV